ncbi:16S rRNA (guanine(527)-N(7))-methyltransferase RsmG, partial [Ureaplasma parvum]
LAPYKELDFFTQNTNLKLIDIGSGSGIPGVVLKIIFKNLNLTLLEANQKRCEFLKILTQELVLNFVLIWNMRAEDLTKS